MIEQRQTNQQLFCTQMVDFHRPCHILVFVLKYPACEFYHFTMPNAETPQYKINVHKLANQSAKMILTKEPHFP